MRQGTIGSVSSAARAWLLAACALGFVLAFWNTFGSPRCEGHAGLEYDGGPNVWTVTYVKPGFIADRAGLRAGDKFALPRTVPYRRFLAGVPWRLRVDRGGRIFYLMLTPAGRTVTVGDWLGNLTTFWMTLFATIVAWFGVGRRSRLLSWQLLFFGNLAGLVTPWQWLNEAAYSLNALTTAVSISLLATISSTFAEPISRQRRVLQYVTYALAVIAGVLLVLQELIFTTPWFGALWPLINFNDYFQPAFVAGLIFGVACILAALGAVRGAERQRAAWMLIPLAGLAVVIAFWVEASAFAGGNYSGHQQALAIAGNIMLVPVLIVLTYAALRRRLLDVNFVINQAVVFAGVSLIVVGVFILVELLFNTFATNASRSASVNVRIATALAIGISLQYIHRYVDKLVDVVFFRKRHEHERSLRTFAHEATFITDVDTLLDDTLREVSVNAETDNVSVLVSDGLGNYTTARSIDGKLVRISENDHAILKLRAWHNPIDLHNIDTALHGQRAYPMTSRGDVLGILVCGDKRDGQTYAPDENEALSMLARSVGSTLDMLRKDRRDDLHAEIDKLHASMAEILDTLRASERRHIPRAQH
ncbi:MAG: GAF domain-containing protein [Candidatus Eremiobacteraeota bacterium]|nr:GAF domain-containing protein [Candidatus Eremiobacteraeota bacterium]